MPIEETHFSTIYSRSEIQEAMNRKEKPIRNWNELPVMKSLFEIRKSIHFLFDQKCVWMLNERNYLKRNSGKKRLADRNSFRDKIVIRIDDAASESNSFVIEEPGKKTFFNHFHFNYISYWIYSNVTKILENGIQTKR